jgi:hypothetical protein
VQVVEFNLETNGIFDSLWALEFSEQEVPRLYSIQIHTDAMAEIELGCYIVCGLPGSCPDLCLQKLSFVDDHEIVRENRLALQKISSF